MDFYIIGSGGFAKEVYFLQRELKNSGSNFNFKGFINHKPTFSTLKVGSNEYKVLDEDAFVTTTSIADRSQIGLAIGIGDASKLQEIVAKFTGFVFPNLIHPNAVFDKESLEFGRGNIITAGCIFTVDIRVEDFNIFNLNTTVGHDTKVGSYNVFNPGCNISGGISIGDSNLFGTNSTILQNLVVGSKSILGAGAVLTKNMESKKLAVGIPATVIKSL
jgi:sugar O-acyltransferase (sialic acid O-acetyltransferase NeuD family)